MLIKTAGVSKSNFYYYFESKEELGLEVLGKLADYQLQMLSQIFVESDLTPPERFYDFYKRQLSYQGELLSSKPSNPGSFFGNLALEQSFINEKFRVALDKYFLECEALVEVCLREGIEKGFFHEQLDPKETAGLLVSQFEGTLLMVKTKKSIAPIKENYEQVKRMTLKEEWWDRFPP